MKLTPKHPALIEKRTIHTRTIKRPGEFNMLKPASYNSKIGSRSNIIVKGEWKGLPLYSLTLEERKTCPVSCAHWDDCYGNGMAFAHRFNHTDKKFLLTLSNELDKINRSSPFGFVVRLHILGDFFSVKYVRFWADALKKYPRLRIYGYTARNSGKIHEELLNVRRTYPSRFWVRFSNAKPFDSLEEDSIYASNESLGKDSFICPEQTEKVSSCLDCALCWTVNKTVQFITHDKLKKGRKANEAQS